MSRGAFLWLCLALFCSPLLARADTSMYQVSAAGSQIGSHSPFLSGTNCSANGAFYLTGPSTVTVTAMYLYVNGTLLRSIVSGFVQPNPLINQTLDGLGVVIDSTHFNDGDTVTVTFTVSFSDGSSITKIASTTVYNKAYVLGNPQFPLTQDFVPVANTGFTTAHYTSTKSLADDRTAILNNLPTYTGFYIDSHGNADGFIDCIGNNNDIMHYINAFKAENAVRTKDTPFPPLPPYSFVFMDTCNTAVNNLMADSFGVASSTGDCGYLGWKTSWCDSHQNLAWRIRFWSKFNTGYPLKYCVAYASGTAIPEDNIKENVAWLPDALNAGDGLAVAQIYGNGNMTLNGTVFGGNRGDWYR